MNFKAILLAGFMLTTSCTSTLQFVQEHEAEVRFIGWTLCLCTGNPVAIGIQFTGAALEKVKEYCEQNNNEDSCSEDEDGDGVGVPASPSNPRELCDLADTIENYGVRGEVVKNTKSARNLADKIREEVGCR